MAEEATLIVTAKPNPAEPAAMQEYLQRVGPMLMGAGGKPACRAKLDQVVAGSPDYGMVLVMTFPSKEAVTALFESAAYQELIPIRDRGFARMDIALAQPL